MRKWHKTIPMKLLHEQFGVYQGGWSRQMDRYWESDDGYTVSSRQIRTEIGVVEHVTIQKVGPGVRGGDIPWAIKQEIKEELFGPRTTAIEVFPAKKNLVDVLDIYHLWILPKDFKMPFGIHPTRDTHCPPVERGYDFNMAEAIAWNESPERKALDSGSPLPGILENLETKGYSVLIAEGDDEENST